MIHENTERFELSKEAEYYLVLQRTGHQNHPVKKLFVGKKLPNFYNNHLIDIFELGKKRTRERFF
jgi:hypothetical protein